MRTRLRIFVFDAFCTVVILFVAGWLLRVLVPYFTQAPDRKLRRAHRIEIEAVADALYTYSRTNGNQFPQDLPLLAPILEATRSTNRSMRPLVGLVADYYYFRPEPHEEGDLDFKRLMLVEKPGHYQREHGSYVCFRGNFVRWCYARDFQELLLKCHVSLSNESAAPK